MNHDAYFTEPFLEQFPGNVYGSGQNIDNAFTDLYQALRDGNLLASADGNALIRVIEILKEDVNRDLAKVLEGLETAGKIKAVEEIKEMPTCFESITMPKKKRQLIGCALAQPADTVYHDNLEVSDNQREFMKAGKKPLFINAQLKSGEIRLLYKEKSAVFNIGDQFQWSSALPHCKVPLTEIRILDPYFYKWIDEIDLESMLKPMVKLSDSNINISVISNVNIVSKVKPEEVKEKVHKTISAINIPKVNFTLYTQKRGYGNLFHKRVLWTNYWALKSDRSFNFTRTSKDGDTKLEYENTLNYTGRYTGKQSTWYDIYDRWNEYLKGSVKIEV